VKAALPAITRLNRVVGWRTALLDRVRAWATGGGDSDSVVHLRQIQREASEEGETIRWFTEPPLPDHLKFYVMVAEAGACGLNLSDHIGEVGHMRLTNGRLVGVWSLIHARRTSLRRDSPQRLREGCQHAGCLPVRLAESEWLHLLSRLGRDADAAAPPRARRATNVCGTHTATYSEDRILPVLENTEWPERHAERRTGPGRCGKKDVGVRLRPTGRVLRAAREGAGLAWSCAGVGQGACSAACPEPRACRPDEATPRVSLRCQEH
jgi:hypothetical protein